MSLRENVAASVSTRRREELLISAREGRITHGDKGIIRRFAARGVHNQRCDAAVRRLVAEGLLELCPDGTVRPTGLPQRTRTAAAEQPPHEGPDDDTLIRIREGLVKL